MCMSSVYADAALIRQAASSSDLPEGTSAGALFEILKDYIEEFQNSLDSEHEVGMMLASFGTSVLMQVSFITYEGPSLLVFEGYVNKKKTTLIQNVNQLNFLLTSIEKEPDRPKVKIGFAQSEEE